MRRITTTFAIWLFISLSQFSLAQEKQNDATWEETIEFLSENIVRFNHRIDVGNDYFLVAYEINENILSEKMKTFYNGKYVRFEHRSVNLKNLKELFFDYDPPVRKGIKLTFEKSSVKVIE